MTAARLKASILQLAVTGKLVPQDSAEGTGEELLREILAAKNAKGAKDKSKVAKSSSRPSRQSSSVTSVPPADAPFEIPANWVWCKLEDIGNSNVGLTYHPSDICEDGVAVLRSNNIKNGQLDLSNLIRVSLAVPERAMAMKHDILICARNGSGALVGKSAIVDQSGMAFGAFMTVFRTEFYEYVYHFLNSVCFRSQLFDANTTTINQITQNKLKSIIIPLPPLAEQKRIVARIEELMPLVEEYGKLEEKRLQLDADLPGALEKAILQDAIQGKLVPHDPAEGTATELLREIQAAKNAKGVKRKSCPKSAKSAKASSVVSVDSDDSVVPPEDQPFEIPSSWTWCKLGSLVRLISGVSYDKDDVAKSGVRILRGGNVKGDGNLYLWDDDVFLPDSYSNPENEIKKGDVVVVAATGSSTVIGRAAIATADMKGVQIGAFLRIARPLDDEVQSWAALIFNSPFYRQHIQDEAKGTNIRNLKAEYITEFAVPLPPLAEQKRIVAKVEQLLAAVRTLKTEAVG